MRLAARLHGRLDDVAGEAGYAEPPARVGFFTDTSVCIGCKACEVACKEWNGIPDDGFDLLGMSYDNTGGLGASSWRHVAFIEQPTGGSAPRVPPEQQPTGGSAPRVPPEQQPTGGSAPRVPPEQQPTGGSAPRVPPEQQPTGGSAPRVPPEQQPTGGSAPRVPPEQQSRPVALGMPTLGAPAAQPAAEDGIRWLMASDVCKHCTHAGCLDVCPTGALFRTEYGSVVVQEDICNGCGYCQAACPYGVIERREDDGRAWKCTLCYDRLRDDLEPACAKACPTDSIQFGPLDELRQRAHDRVQALHEAGVVDARLYGDDPDDGVGGQGAFFLLLDEPEVYGLPPDPVVPTRDLPRMFAFAGAAAGLLLAAAVSAFVEGRRP